ncbi:MAG: hypothetical protein ISS82_02380 [Nanoarchaeota archaeon]|nr:hypothetical protein [Nanoarchaeota archaeon]
MAKKEKDPKGFLFPACILIGLGIGMLFNQVAVGVLIGVGVGFLALFIVKKK